ncbi:protein of unknown function [Actinopolyspora xinjiangensis]|uniref:DUF4190 domain-containing protein n=1 Tax=Actinopolyspora xinjiangensis TaxID=405564 RepID=A0A1H0UBQ0_9ACTN|nr:DUF4190 domain-containing protein [Actinopolyspora xinjiangensis]SDP63742.1 protein of unknown function [Actinopolyspora xinjiangensis]
MTNPYGSGPHNPPSDSGGFPQPYQSSYGGGFYPGYQPGQQYPQYQPVAPGYPGGHPPNNGMAIASMVLSLAAIPFSCMWGFGIVPAILGVVFGHMAKKQIQRDGSYGDGMATAGLVIGYCLLGLVVAVVVLLVIGLSLPLMSAGSM